MARVRTVEFLPEIFQTPANRQFLNATLDQLVQEPAFKKTQGYVGRKIGPGVNPEDRYVVEPTAVRNDYQLEPGVVTLDPTDTTKVTDAITYPGITDALNLQGALTNNSDRLYTSEYYSWDPFVDLDKFVNYAQYYWLPSGPLDVDVSSTTVPLTDNFTVTRENGVYTFSGVSGTNPALTLVRGGNYTFQVAQNAKETVNYRVTNNNISSYVIDYEPNPTLTLSRGNTYVFNLTLDGVYPFYIKTIASLGDVNTYNTGVLRNGATTGIVTFTVPQDAPDTLYYSCSDQFNMRGQINIIDGTPGTGPGFWIQTDPGISGRLPATPNISSRDVLGVTNNGEDLGTVTFDVPLSTAQSFYYGLTSISPVDLITNLNFNQINNQPVDEFIANGGIDGITSLDGKTLVFQQTNAGWEITVLGGGFGGGFDSATPIDDPAVRYSVWQINYVTIDSVQYIQLSSVLPVANLEKFQILFGTEYSSTSWYKTAEGVFQEIPLLTAARDLLYYQDGTDPEIFGQIRLIDQTQSSTLNIADIVDHPNYTSPNGVVFTNGLKVTFRGQVNPSSYQNQTYYVEGVGTAIKLLPIGNFVTPETYTQSSTVPYDSTPYDVGNFDATLNAPLVPDYLTVNRAAPDLDPWCRSNRWFHIDVINASAAYNNTVAVVDNLQRARRPILEFRAGTKLFDFGTQGIQPVDIIDSTQTDALSNINGTIGYSIDGYTFIEGTRVIFAADTDLAVRSQVYVVQFITPDTVPPLIAEPIINLVPVGPTITANQNTVCLSGNTLQGQSFYFDGVEWISAQQKTKNNQAPLFDVYDTNGISFSNRAVYPSSTFTGSKLFSYAVGTGTSDVILGFPLQYLSLSNVGDIVFANNFYADTFVYAPDSLGTTVPISNGFVRQYTDRVTYSTEIGWQTAVTKSRARQQFQFTYDAKPLKLDVKVISSNIIPPVQLYVNSAFQESYNYTVTTTDTTTTITLLTAYTPGDIIEVAVLSDQVSPTAFYQVPVNLQNNPFNGNSQEFTLGTIRAHYESIGENLINISGPIIGANNTRDLGNIIPYGEKILQQSSPLTLAGFFMRDPDYNIFASLDYNSREYIKFKSKLLEAVVTNDYGTMTIPEVLDAAIADITLGRTDINPFYWSDMLPTGPNFTRTNTTVTAITTATFNTIQTYDFTSSNYLGLLVYIIPQLTPEEPILLERDVEYVVSTDSPRITITVPLAIGDVVSICEYSNTAGSFVPNTPTKLGLYPKFRPAIYLDTAYVNPTLVIRGHDGSTTVAFNDYRDEVLLEFEKRIYDNLKTDDNPIPLTVDEVIPGFFRTTDYTMAEINQILGESFLSWVGWNKLDYNAQDYIAGNPFTYNYSQAGSKLNSQDQISNTNETPLPGAWRGIYRYFYDTVAPDTAPWEMLGFSEEPSYWADRYGPAPYTSDNLVLWDDLAAGYVADPVAPYVLPQYIRPNLQSIIPVGTEGQLLNPLESVVGLYDPTAFQKSWQVGDGGPVEAAWWSSSSYPFAVMRLLALTRPAEFFALFADRDNYRYSAALDQYLYNGRYRLNASGVQVYGDGISKASYIDWIVDYNQQLGFNSTNSLTQALANLDVRLCYRMASFTEKQNLEVYLERSGPNSTNSSLILPPESYKLQLYKNQPFNNITYSALIVERVESGYAVFGYSTVNPYFEIFVSSSYGALRTVSAGGTSVRVPTQYTNNIIQIPYGYVFANTTMVVDFILSYGVFLESQGMTFDDQENGYTLNWSQMAQEFLYFSQQGWAPGTMINLNPVATKLTVTKPGAIVDTIISTTPENMLLNQNRGALPTRDLIIERQDNTFKIQSLTGQTISFLELRFTSYEDIIILNNVSIFNDLVYDPITAARQNRIRLSAYTSTDWNGQLDAQGFILNAPNVEQWEAYKKYTKGEIVIYKNQYWSALTLVQPKEKFEYSDWVKSNYNLIQQGLLPNIANKADQLANTYNTYSANLNSDNDLLAYGLIGFRPRQYMSDLNLDDTTQVQLYQQFLGTKGTTRSAEIFTRADLGKETGAYDIFENWAVLAGTYGANANRSYYELQLNEANLQADPATVQVIQPQQPSQADQTVLLQNVWKSSYKLTSTDILPTTYDRSQETALPSAGYVSLDDIDITVFTLDDPTNIESAINTIGIGTVIWVAKTNSYDWNIYRCAETSGKIFQLQDNLNGTSLAQFNKPHNLSVGDLIIIKYFNTGVDGVFRVLSVPNISSIVIAFSFVNTNQTSITGDGLVFVLETMRVTQASDIVNLDYAKSLLPGAKVWVDNNGSGHWEVVEKQDVFSSYQQLVPAPLVSNSKYGSSVAQSLNHFAAMVGAPNDDTGVVHTYRRDEFTAYVRNLLLTLNAIDTNGFGNSVDIGGYRWGAIGASASNNYAGYVNTLYFVPGSNDLIQGQLLVAPDQEFDPIKFGHAVSLSNDDRWMYISAPVKNRVYAYGLVEVEQQSVSYVSDGVTKNFPYSQAIQIDSSNPGQLTVSIGDLVAIYGQDYLINGTNVLFNTAPVKEQLIKITRKQSAAFDQATYYGVTQNSTSGSGIGAIFTVTNTRGEYDTTITAAGSGYAVGNTLTVSYTQVCPAGSAANNLTITVTSVVDGGITGFTTSGSGISNTATFQLQEFLYTATNIYSFTVFVDGVYQRPHLDYDFNNDSTSSTQDLTFTAGHIPAAGALITVVANSYWQYVDTISPGLIGNALFGDTISTGLDGRTLVVGAPTDQVGSVVTAGSSYVYDRSVVRYEITDTTETTYNMPGGYNAPVAVVLNGQYLTNSDQFINGQFAVSGNDIVLSGSVNLTIGDVLEIETNQFQLVERLVNSIPNTGDYFGGAVKLSHDASLAFVGAPFDTNVLPQDGGVYVHVNQSRVYGVTTSTIANPSLTAGDTIRINNTEVAVPASPNNNIAGLAAAINNSGIPNVIATPTPNITYIANGVNKVFDAGTTYSAASSYTTVVYVDDVLQTIGADYSYSSSTGQISFVTAPASTSVVLIVSGRLTVSVKNATAATPNAMITVLPGMVGSAFADMGWDTYVLTQEIYSPTPSDYAQFGTSIDIDADDINLVIGAPNGNVIQPVTFDLGQTTFDAYSTRFISPIYNSGVVYTYNLLSSANPSITNPGNFVFGQQVYSNTLLTGDQFGIAVNYTNNRLIVGAPGSDVDNGTGNYGEVSVFDNPNKEPAWKIIHAQQPAVDVNLLNSVFSYDKATSKTTQYFDFIDPLQGKILGAARRNIDYIGAVDPAQYNQGAVHNNGSSWASEHLGEIWWDTDTVRFIDPSQDNITYASRRWGQVFPGSRVDIYQWIGSSVPPAQYTGTGTPLSTISYTVNTALNKQNIVETTYYFWVRGITTIETGAGKTLSTTGIASYIESPRSSGIPYIAALNASTVAIYNALNLISAQDTILHIGFDRQAEGGDSDIHQEYQFVTDGRPSSFLNATLYRKLQDSFCGVDASGAAVPDTTLSIAERYGVQFRPRQSMFADRYSALQNYLTRVNNVLAQYPISEMRSFNLLNSSEPIPSSSSGAWDKQVANLEELSYQLLDTVPVGYKYLVDSDSSQNGRWTIYEVELGQLPGQRVLALMRIQNYVTPEYWNYINWYRPGYNSTVQPLVQVPNYSALDTITLTTVPVGGSAKVLANGQGKYEIYLRTATGWDRVGLEDGTIAFKQELWDYVLGNFGFDTEVFDAQYFDQEPVIETRKIIQAINEELLIDELLVERNSALILMFNFVYSEFTAPDWLMKTSLIDVDHHIRSLLPYQIYQQDNQTFVLDYIQEVKPYHVQVREFNLSYNGQDNYLGALTDFDVPAYWNTSLQIPQYVSPVLLPYTHAESTIQNIVSDAESNAAIWLQEPWAEWYNNYLLEIQSVTVIDGGVGYTDAPVVEISGTSVSPAVMTATINSAGQVVSIDIIDPGYGYSTTATITLVGGNGTGARAVAVMGNDLVRNIKTTIKYDRYEYQSTIVDWTANVTYPSGTQVRYANRVWSANATVSGTEFNPADWTLVQASTLSGVNRTQGFYTPTANEPGLELGLLIDGIDYPGVQVAAVDFNQDTGYDVGNYDINPFDNISLDANGLPTYDYGILDAMYSSSYLDLYLGTRPTDINVDGGAYIDTFSSHAPEELVPGSEFDTLDMRVYTTPGSDWTGNGHGFPIASRRYVYDPATPALYFGELLPYPMVVVAYNVTTKLAIEPSSYDWVNYTLEVDGSAAAGDIIQINVVATGGGNQLYNNTYIGSDIVDQITIPFPYSAIYEFVIYNGEQLLEAGVDYTYAASTASSTLITFDTTYGATDRINLTALGYAQTGTTYSWSLPVFQTWIADGSMSLTLTNSLQGTNPVNLIVTRNGVRARPYEGIRYTGNGATTVYDLPTRGGYSQELIADNDVIVYVDNVQLTLNVDYFVSIWDGSSDRTVTLVDAPAVDATILISVATAAQYRISGDQLVFSPSAGLSPQVGDIIEITTWNDTSEQNILTQVFVGPETAGTVVSEAYDETLYDVGLVTGGPGTFDYSSGTTTQGNEFDTGEIIIDPERLSVTLDGNWLFYGQDYTVSGTKVIILGPPINTIAVVAITSFTQSVVPGSMAFRIFQDMRGAQATYRITPATTTTLAQPLTASADIVYLTNASAVSQPDLALNIWGVITIDGERIMYRDRDTTANTVSGLLRGTAGTAAASHAVGALVYDMGRGNLLPAEFQNYVVSNTILSDGSSTVFVATDVDITYLDSTTVEEAVEVYVGGELTTTGYTITSDNPVTVEFVEAPLAGIDITILVRRGVTWYAPGAGTASDGVPLQDTNTAAARFLRGLN